MTERRVPDLTRSKRVGTPRERQGVERDVRGALILIAAEMAIVVGIGALLALAALLISAFA